MKFLQKNKNKEFNFKAIVRYLIEAQVAEIKTYTIKAISFRAARTQLDNLAIQYSKDEGFTNYEIAVLRNGTFGPK